MNPALWLDRTARLHPSSPALFDGTQQIANYATFAHQAAALASSLIDGYAVRPGERVALFMANRPEYLVSLYAIWWAGAVPVPVNAKLHPNEAAWILSNCRPKVLIGTGIAFSAVRQSLADEHMAAIDVSSDAYRTALAAQPRLEPTERSIDDLAWLFYTSGTTGRPKGAMITCGNILAMTQSYFADVDAVEEGDATLYAAPISHGAGLYNFMFVIRAGRHIFPASGGFDPSEIIDIVPGLRCVSMFAAPTMVRRLVAEASSRGYDGDGFSTIVYGGGPMYLSDILQAVEVMGARFAQIYGQGECPMTITAAKPWMVADRISPRWRERLASVGTAQSSVCVRVVGADCAPLPIGEVGEICVKGAPVMKGYWEDVGATEATFRDGWLLTGDIGELDGDGFLTLRDRSKDVIISGGSNIYPREVEEVLLTHPSVSEACVVGKSDAEWGEIVVAYVVAGLGQVIDKSELDAFCLAQLARFKRPKTYICLPELPKNAYGKVLKSELRRMT